MNLLKKLAYKISEPILGKINPLRDCHSGETFYILGDGISLKWFDLNNLTRFKSISLAYIPYHLDVKSINLKYSFLTQPYWFYPLQYVPHENRYIINKIQPYYRHLIKNSNDIKYFINLSNFPVLRGNNVYHLFKKIPGKKFDFVEDCLSSGEEIYGGAFRAAITIAIYMGIKTLYLVGCDYTHENSLVGHWYERGAGNIRKINDYEGNFLRIAQKYIEIVTITKEGKSNLMPSVTYEEHTGLKPSFRENDKLMSYEKRLLLSNWSDYKMF